MTHGNFPLCKNCTVPVLSLVSVWYRVIALCFCTGITNICVLLHVTAGHQSKNVGTVRFCKTQQCWNFTLPSLQLPLLHRTWLENVSSKIPGLVAFNKTWKYPDVSSKEFVFATNLDENFPTSLQKYPVFLPLTQCRNYTKIFLKSAFVVVPMYEMCRFEQTCVLQTCQMPTCYLEAVPSSPRRDNISPPESRPVLWSRSS